MKATAAVFVLVAAVCSQAASAPKQGNIFPPHLIVADFIPQYRGIHKADSFGSGTQYAQRYAVGYMAGVADVSQGDGWCTPNGLNPNEADDIVVAALEKRMSTQVAQPHGSFPLYAAPYLLMQYVAQFPNNGTCTFNPHLTADEFAKQLIGELDQPGITKLEQSRDATNKQRYAEGYLAGVVDATQGHSWCAPSRMKPMEVDDRMLTELDKRKAKGGMPGNAATILLALYQARFPCPRK